MPSIRYMNQAAPFWDFVANVEDQGPRHPFFSQYGNRNADSDTPMEEDSYGWGWGSMPHRRRNHRHSHPHPPPPPPPRGDGPAPPYTEGAPDPPEEVPEKEGAASPGDDTGEGPSAPRGPPNWHGRRGGSHGRGRGGCGGFGGRHHGRRGPRGGFPFDFGGFGPMADFFQSQVFGNERENADGARNEQGDFRPAVDVFDTEGAFVVHVSLAGAKKEDVGVSWDADKSELSIAGVIHRPGDEDFLKTLALDERKVGAFQREVRLGTRANPALVDPDAITAKFEDGVLRVEVPKLDKEDYVEVKKVDIE